MTLETVLTILNACAVIFTFAALLRYSLTLRRRQDAPLKTPRVNAWFSVAIISGCLVGIIGISLLHSAVISDVGTLVFLLGWGAYCVVETHLQSRH
jgi:hypothetical protein